MPTAKKNRFIGALALAIALPVLVAAGARALTWLYGLVRVLWFLAPRRERYCDLKTQEGRIRLAEDLLAEMGYEEPVLTALTRFNTWTKGLGASVVETLADRFDACYCAYRNGRYLVLHPEVRRRYLRLKRKHRLQSERPRIGKTTAMP